MTIRHDLEIRQGTTWQYSLVIRDAAGLPVDLTGYAARLAMKVGLEDFYEAFLSSGADAQGGSIALAADGTVTLSMTARQSSVVLGELSFLLLGEDRRPIKPVEILKYDLELVAPDGSVSRPLEGRVHLYREVTR